MNTEQFKSLLQSINKYYNDDLLDEVTKYAKILGMDTAKFLKEKDGLQESFDVSFYKSLIYIIDNERKKLSQNLTNANYKALSLIRAVIGCLRNSFYKTPLNQRMASEKEEFREPMLILLSILVKDLLPLHSNSMKNQPLEIKKITVEDSQDFQSQLSCTSSDCIATFVNMMAGNTRVRNIIWPFLQPLILDILCFPAAEVCHMGSALLHQFLIEEELKKDILGNFGAALVSPLLKAYLIEGPHSCFSLFCLEILTDDKDAIPSSWKKLTDKQRLLALDIFASRVQKGNNTIPISTIQFFQGIFKEEADQIFGILNNTSMSVEPKVVTRITNFLCCTASSDHFRSTLQKDKSFLISSVYLLKGITDIGDVSNNVFSRVGDMDQETDEIESHPAFGFKSDLIRLIAGLVFRNKDNQDTVREINGLLLVLENSQFDARNPLVREASIFALRNLLEQNPENQKILSQLKLERVSENRGLEQLGMSASIQDGKVSLHQI